MPRLELKEFLQAGLFRRTDASVNTPGLRTAYRGRLNENGFVPAISANRFQTNISYSHPHPQSFQQQDGTTFVLGASALSSFTSSGGSPTSISLKDRTTQLTTTIQSGGGVWHGHTTNTFQMFCNTANVIFSSQEESLTGATKTWWIDKTIQASTMCVLRGRLLLSGFDSANFLSSTWTSFWNEWNAKQASGLNTSWDLALGSGQVWWGRVGGGDSFQIFDRQIGLGGAFPTEAILTSYKNQLFESFVRGQGFGTLPVEGAVQKLLPLEMANRVLAFSDSGVTLLVPTMLDSLPTFGMELVNHSGIYDRGSAGVGTTLVDNRPAEWVVWIDKEKMIWQMFFFRDGSYTLERMDYRNHVQDLINEASSSTACVINYHPNEQEFYFNFEKGQLVLTRFGLTRTGTSFAGLTFNSGVLYTNSGSVSDTGASSTLTVQTDAFNMGDTRKKKIVKVTIEGEDVYTSGSSMVVGLQWRNSKQDSWSTVVERPVNQNGDVVGFNLTAHDFLLTVKQSRPEAVRIENIIVFFEIVPGSSQ